MKATTADHATSVEATTADQATADQAMLVCLEATTADPATAVDQTAAALAANPVEEGPAAETKGKKEAVQARNRERAAANLKLLLNDRPWVRADLLRQRMMTSSGTALGSRASTLHIHVHTCLHVL